MSPPETLASPPNVMAAAAPSGGDLPWLVVGCDDGSVVALDGTGEPVRSAKLDSRVEDIVITGGDQPVAVMGSVKGQVAIFEDASACPADCSCGDDLCDETEDVLNCTLDCQGCGSVGRHLGDENRRRQ